jgi:ABC-type glycerol-3-phosphate transport system substrate-binding protein
MQPQTTCFQKIRGLRFIPLTTARWFLAILLTGCVGSVQATQTPAITPTPTARPTASPTPTSEPQPLITTIKLWLPEELDPYDDNPGANVLMQQLTEFNRTHHNIQIEVTVKKVHGRGGIIDYLNTAREAAPSVLPDLVIVGAQELDTLAALRHIQPLDDLLASERRDDLFPFAVQMGTVGEQTGVTDSLMGLVISTDVHHMVYRTDLFSVPPVSWGQIITPPIPFIFPAGDVDDQINEVTLIQYLAAGGELFDEEGNPKLDTRALVRVLTFYDDCVKTGAISPTVVLEITDTDQAWQTFETGLGDITVVQASQYWSQFLTGYLDESFSIASVPTQDGQPLTIARESWAIAMVTQDSDRQAQAMTALDWLITPENNAEWTQAVGYLPSTRSALRLWDIPVTDQLALRAVLEAAVPAPPMDTIQYIGPAIQTAVKEVLTGNLTPQEAAIAAAQSLVK